MPKSKKMQEKELKKLENQVENVEKTIEVVEKVNKEKRKAEKEEKRRLAAIDKKVDIIKEDLLNQLSSQGKFGKYFTDMVDDYVYLVKLKEDLQNDININGLRYERKTGNGYTTQQPNESVKNLLNVNGQMLKILQDLDLKSPDDKGGDGDDLL